MNNSFSIAIVSILISNIHSTEINQLPDIKQSSGMKQSLDMKQISCIKQNSYITQSSDMKQISYIKKIHI